MKIFATTLIAIFAVSTANASRFHDSRLLVHRHSAISPRSPTVVSVNRKRCRPRNTGGDSAPSHTQSTLKPQTTNPPPKNQTQPLKSTGNILNVKPGQCGSTGATGETTKTGGPNGNMEFLNCGINSRGWNPPDVKISDIVFKPLSNKGPFSGCSKYFNLFEQFGGQFGIPPIMLASFAMQESSCNPNVVGGGGEQGLMQLTKDKCGDAPGGNCRDPSYNVRTGASYFAKTLKENGYNVIVAVGYYNGWKKGMTAGEATAAANSACCKCQRNLDYLHQFFNGWLQNINPYDLAHRLGQYFNLDVCK